MGRLMLRVAVMLLVAYPALAREGTVVLTGRDLTLEQVVAVARDHAPVEIAAGARARAETAYLVLLAAAAADMPVYGLNRGVGSMRQVRVLQGDVVNPEIQRISEAFNRNMLLTHNQSVGPEASEAVVRATMLIRLNTALFGGTALRPDWLDRFAAFLNAGIHPVMRTRGSIGEADIFVLPAVGLTMMGIGDVRVRGGARRPATEALREAGLEPLAPFGKDALGLLSNNAYAAAITALAAHDARQLLDSADRTYALSLEALNGNVSPFHPASLAMRPYASHREAATVLRGVLEGSYLWRRHPQRILQDPLSFRDASQAHGALRAGLARLDDLLRVQMNASDDNPTVAVDVEAAPDAPEVDRVHFVSGTVMGRQVRGAVFPTAHFEPLAWSLEAQALSVTLSHVANHSMQRSNRLTSPSFVDLAPTAEEAAAGATVSSSWKTTDSLFAELVSLTNPISVRVLPSARDIEDVGTNAPLVARRLAEVVDLSYRIVAIELMVAGQVVDLRRRADPSLTLGAGTRPLLASLREVVPFLNPGRRMGEDAEAAYRVLRGRDAQPDDRAFEPR